MNLPKVMAELNAFATKSRGVLTIVIDIIGLSPIVDKIDLT